MNGQEIRKTIPPYFDHELVTVTPDVLTLAVALRAATLACLMSSRFLRRFNSVSGTVGNFLGLNKSKRYVNTLKYEHLIALAPLENGRLLWIKITHLLLLCHDHVDSPRKEEMCACVIFDLRPETRLC